jgi:hypothetical protein
MDPDVHSLDDDIILRNIILLPHGGTLFYFNDAYLIGWSKHTHTELATPVLPRIDFVRVTDIHISLCLETETHFVSLELDRIQNVDDFHRTTESEPNDDDDVDEHSDL